MAADAPDLRRAAREIFAATLSSVDAGAAVRRAVRLDGSRLTIVDRTFNLRTQTKSVYSVAVGKAAHPMAAALDEILGARLAGGVLSAPSRDLSPSPRWQTFAGGHPLPNDASIDAARAALELLRLADHPSTLVIFLVSGGGSALLELPRDVATTLDDLRAANRALVSCGASIAEINAVRRALSAVKGGGLSRCAPRAAQATLIVSDTGAGEAHNVASGLTFPPPAGEPDARAIVARYRLASKLPASILRTIERRDSPIEEPEAGEDEAGEDEATGELSGDDSRRLYHVLLDNTSVIERAAESAVARGFVVEVAGDVVEQPVDEGCAALVARLFELRQRMSATGRVACLVSGGEFSCPVRGTGTGGRNAETALRCALEIETRNAAEWRTGMPRVVAFSAGTDGIDGNSPAAGAIADDTTLERARRMGFDAQKFLDASDAHTFFNALGDSVITGPTGTNVRDLRILLAS